MYETYEFLLTLGVILLAGLATDAIGRHTFLPRVTLLLLFGVVIGKQMLDLIPQFFIDRFEIISNMTLLMVGFLLGGKLTADFLKQSAEKTLLISISTAIITVLVVITGLMAVGVPAGLAILLGCVASATAPAATLDIVLESDDRGFFSDLLLSIVALDDVWGLILFSIGVAVVMALSGNTTETFHYFFVIKDIGGALLLGLGLGFPAAYLTGRIRKGQPMLMEALGLVFLCGGLALLLEVSFLVASIVMGSVVANFATHHEYPFHEIENIEWPFMSIFFVLAGASLEFISVMEIGMIGIVYILSRIIGKLLGARIGAEMSGADSITRDWMGFALLPQAGIAMGMALVASNQFPEYRQALLTIVISSTVFFELIGPVFTRMALRRAGK
ncbi:MAG: sodium:proton antiporter [gamma proteobacterium symbiont of Ctena orbiculata]|nr:MAG: sodium:proton antiporter [gamma proteobacterium symbiont of Ctena orbiculata]PVV19020.1 MAG: sodium:proton antiporter [gamma proteobacterium symbiont of Ctena orbiculata]